MCDKETMVTPFIKCLADHLHGRVTEVPEDLDYGALLDLARKHNLTGMVHYQLNKSGRSNPRFHQGYLSTLYAYAGRVACLRKVTDAFAQQCIPYSLVKGAALDGLYPVPALRTMGDVDILIREEDKPSIDRIMLAQGYTCLTDASAYDWAYENKTIEIELHSLLCCPNEMVEKQEFISFFNDFWQYVDEQGELNKEFHLLYLLVHLRKHMLNHGAGIRQFMDVAVFTRAYEGQLDWEWIQSRLKQLGLTRFAEMVYSFNEVWFEMPTPLKRVEIEQEFFEECTARILDNGVFGFQAEDDGQGHISYAVARSSLLGKAEYYLRLVFPTYGLMQGMEEYSFLKEKKWLLPAAWLLRIYYILRKGNAGSKIMGMRSGVSEERIKMIEMWGMK